MKTENEKAMTDEQKCVKIAEACGKHQYYGVLYQGSRCITCGELFEEPQHYFRPPDYLNDLNAMHEAEETLDDAACQNYVGNLAKVTGAEFEGVPGADPLWNHFAIYHASARQRAEAFLLTIG